MNTPSNEAADSFDQLDEMLEMMFDSELTEEQVTELNQRLLNDPAARKRSLEAAQMHADLHAYFNEAKAPSAIAPALPLPIPGMGMPTGS